MKFNNTRVGIVLSLLVIAYALTRYSSPATQPSTAKSFTQPGIPVTITPIEHATTYIAWGNEIILTDPVQKQERFASYPKPTIILITDIHGDHFSTSTLLSIVGDASIIAPQAVIDLMPEELKTRTTKLANNQTITVRGIKITGIPMYNIPESKTAMHTKGRGNGYTITKDGYTIYVAGDTSGTPEMKALKNIDMALIPMNLPYTMSVEEAASATIAFEPKIAIPYHYRGKSGLSDVEQFSSIIKAHSTTTEIVLLTWYPDAK
jgi:L-ascorbate metabolism protein UlaG (beta-lactamase superfamily)